MNWQYHILAVGKTSVVGIAACRPYYMASDPNFDYSAYPLSGPIAMSAGYTISDALGFVSIACWLGAQFP